MNHFTISDIENLTGIKAHTLRIWEHRYGVCNGKRKDSGHRYYDDEDLKKMLRLSILYKNGFKISKLASLSDQELRKLASVYDKGCFHENYIEQLMFAAQAFDFDQFDKLLRIYIEQLGFEKAVIEVFYPFLEKMGMYWLTDKAMPAQEHFSSNLIQKSMMLAIDELHVPVIRTDKKILLFTPKGEAHEIPLLFMQYLFKQHGKATVYMGAEVELSSIEFYCRHKKVTHLYFHLITHLNNIDLKSYLEELTDKAQGAKIIVSGPALKDIADQLPHGIKYLRSLQELLTFAKAN